MKNLILLFCSIILSTTLFAQSNSQKLDEMIQQGMEDWKIPGLAAVVVKDGEIVYQKTYGTKDIDTQDPVNENTLFRMASTTKAFVGIAMGMLVDQGKVNWDDKVITHLPSFKFSDPYITKDARIIDLFTHNLGAGNADFLWSLMDISTNEILERFQNTPMIYPTRGGFQYQNIMYVVAGQVIEAVSGMTWNKYVEQNIFKPLEMNRSKTNNKNIITAKNYVTPHYRNHNDSVVKLKDDFGVDRVSAAGSQWTSISDISNYLKFLQNGGVFNGDTLLSPETFNYLFQPKTVISDKDWQYPATSLANPNWKTYGVAWFQHDYRGHKIDFHTGSIGGAVAIIAIVKDKNLAVAFFANMDHAELRHAVMYKAIDLFAFDDDATNWNNDIFELYKPLHGPTLMSYYIVERNAKRVLGTKPTLNLEHYTGIYINKMGELAITLVDGKLKGSLNGKFEFPLNHWQDDSFISDEIEDFPLFLPSTVILTFLLNEKKEVHAIMGESGDLWQKSK